MPIYEYRCEACGRVTSQLVLKSADETPPACGACASLQTRRVMSRFCRSAWSGARPASCRRWCPSPGSRNVGLWAKKRAQDLGVDLGSQFEETVEKARTGKILDEM